MQGMREAQHHYYHHNASNATYGDRIDLSNMSPEDRAKHMGYDVDPQVSNHKIHIFDRENFERSWNFISASSSLTSFEKSFEALSL